LQLHSKNGVEKKKLIKWVMNSLKELSV